MEKMEDRLLHSCVFMLARLIKRDETDATGPGLSPAARCYAKRKPSPSVPWWTGLFGPGWNAATMHFHMLIQDLPLILCICGK